MGKFLTFSMGSNQSTSKMAANGAYNPSDPLLAFITSKLPAGTNFIILFVTVSYVKNPLKEMDHKKARGVDQINTNLIHKLQK